MAFNQARIGIPAQRGTPKGASTNAPASMPAAVEAALEQGGNSIRAKLGEPLVPEPLGEADAMTRVKDSIKSNPGFVVLACIFIGSWLAIRYRA